MFTVLGTWSFSKDAAKAAYVSLEKRKGCVEAIGKGINVAEKDEKYGPCVVGRGGFRNAEGHLELDAAIMDGMTMEYGAVTALQGFSTPISVARSVMYNNPHNILTGEGAKTFALSQNFEIEQSLLEPKYCSIEDNQNKHDTLGMIAVDSSQPQIAVGVTTSGQPDKHPGRVGDSALPGCGLYADNNGAACCTGNGDEILKFCPAFHAVNLMSMLMNMYLEVRTTNIIHILPTYLLKLVNLTKGKSPNDACEEVVRIIENRLDKYIEIGIIAVNRKGDYGASTTVKTWTDPLTSFTYDGFPYVIVSTECPDSRIEVCRKH